MTLLDELRAAKFVVIARRVPADRIVLCAKAAASAGVRFLEITFDPSDPGTLADTADKVKSVRAALPALRVGCGTVLNAAMATAAAEAGAEYLVAPNTRSDVIAIAHRYGIAAIPGAFTPTEIAAAYDLGADIVKIFPVRPGEESYVANVMSPLSHIPFMVTGGVNPDTAAAMLRTGAAAIAAGASILRSDLVASGNYAEITRLAKLHLEKING